MFRNTPTCIALKTANLEKDISVSRTCSGNKFATFTTTKVRP